MPKNTILRFKQIDSEGHELRSTDINITDKDRSGADIGNIRKLFIMNDTGDITCCLKIDINQDGSVRNIELDKYK